MSERQDGEVVQSVARAGLGSVEDAGDLVTVDEDVADGSLSRPSAVPGSAASASTGGFRHRTCGVGIGAMAIAWTSTSARR
ncbi:MAG TPA: hypothetical protein VGI58_13895 [Streptosporangiaceae bacterium]